MILHKLQAAERQLETAALLFVDNGDLLSVHTLAGAAEEILGKLAERISETNIFERMRYAVEKKFGHSVSARRLSTLVNQSRNSLKHANDPMEDDFDYEEDHAIGMLFRALVNYQLVTGGLTEPMDEALDKLRKDHQGLFPGNT